MVFDSIYGIHSNSGSAGNVGGKLVEVGNEWLDETFGRMMIWIDGEHKRKSHYIYFLNTGHWPDWSKDEMIHHIDGDKLNDSFKNLRLMTNSGHSELHNQGENNPNSGNKWTDEQKRMLAEGRMGEDNGRWLGDNAGIQAKYIRHLKSPEKYSFSEAERKELNAYCREKRHQREAA